MGCTLAMLSHWAPLSCCLVGFRTPRMLCWELAGFQPLGEAGGRVFNLGRRSVCRLGVGNRARSPDALVSLLTLSGTEATCH